MMTNDDCAPHVATVRAFDEACRIELILAEEGFTFRVYGDCARGNTVRRWRGPSWVCVERDVRNSKERPRSVALVHAVPPATAEQR